MFKKKKKQDDIDALPPIDEEQLPINQKPTFWDVISPEGMKIHNDDHGIIKQSLGSKTYFRPFYITRDGYPRKLRTHWINNILEAGEVDIMFDIHKSKKKDSIRMLQKQDTILRSNLNFQVKRGNQDQILDNKTKIEDTEILMEEIQFNENDSFLVGTLANVYASSESELDKKSEELEDSLSGLSFKVASTWGRVKKGFRSVTPFAQNEIGDSLRNLDRRSLSTFAPFISGSGKYNGGIPIGTNLHTEQKEFYNAFGTEEDRPDNYNMSIFGSSGSGKSIALKMLLARETTGMGIYTRIIDVEGEFCKITTRLGGTNLNISEESAVVINPLAINVSTIEYDEKDEELESLEVTDDREIINKDGKVYISFVPLREKINEALDFFDIILRGKDQKGQGLNVFESNYIEDALNYVFKEVHNITTHPSSLFDKVPKEVDGQIIQSKVRKAEPTISEVYQFLQEHYGEEEKALRIIAAIRPFLRNGSRPIFDGQTYLGKNVTANLHTSRLVNFNLSDLEEGFLRPLAYHVLLNFIWEYFIKNPKNARKKKILLCDEYWTLVDNDQTVSFSEKVSRRCRKRNCGFRIASQDFVRILESKKARAVLQNSHSYMFLKQKKIDLKLIKENFDLTKGEVEYLFNNPERGEGVLRVGGSSVLIKTDPSEKELDFIESNIAVLEERKKKREFAMKS